MTQITDRMPNNSESLAKDPYKEDPAYDDKP